MHQIGKRSLEVTEPMLSFFPCKLLMNHLWARHRVGSWKRLSLNASGWKRGDLVSSLKNTNYWKWQSGFFMKASWYSNVWTNSLILNPSMTLKSESVMVWVWSKRYKETMCYAGGSNWSSVSSLASKIAFAPQKMHQIKKRSLEVTKPVVSFSRASSQLSICKLGIGLGHGRGWLYKR